MNKKVSIVICTVILLIILGLSGCIENSDVEINNTTPDTFVEKIVGLWERTKDNRTFHYFLNGTLHIEGATNSYRYWFEDGYLFDTSEGETTAWIYKYNITFENNDTMVLLYLGYYLDDEWNPEEEPIEYIFTREAS
jgi:hypothetical protein